MMTNRMKYCVWVPLLVTLSTVLAYRMTALQLTPQPPEPFTQEELARMELEVLEQSLDAFRSDVGRYPTNAEGLQALVGNLGAPNWQGPYLQWTTAPLDPWGKPLKYNSLGNTYRVWSLGPGESDAKDMPGRLAITRTGSK